MHIKLYTLEFENHCAVNVLSYFLCLKLTRGYLGSMIHKTNFCTIHIDSECSSREYNSGFTDSVCDDAHRVKVYYHMCSRVVKLH